MAGKHYQDADVHAATLSRLRLVFRNFERVCVAFSGGKDSSVTLQLALDVARELGRSPVDVLFIDLEGQYQATIDHVSEMLGRPDVRPWWVCLPLNLRNASSLEEPYWCCWEPGAEADWVRPLPKQRGVISDPAFFPFYRYRMEFEEFVAGFNAWLAREEPTAFLVGIRSDESLNRYLAVKRRSRAKQCAWTPPGGCAPLAWSARDRANPQAVSFFPIYDWRFEDLWRCVADHGYAYNRLYDQMYRAGVPFSQMRICQPYGDDQRKGLDLFHRIEPRTWFKVVRRVAGANYGARYCRQRFLGYRGGLGLPPSFGTWREYSQFLLRSMPPPLRGIYQRRIERFILWWKQHDYPLAIWPDAGIPALENRRKQPSWRRIALSLLKQDMARSLSFGFSQADIDRLVPVGRSARDPPARLRDPAVALVRRRGRLLRQHGPLLRQRPGAPRMRRLPAERRSLPPLVRAPPPGGHADTGVRQPGATSRRGSPARCLPACGSARSRAVPHPARAGPRACRPTRAGLYHPRAPGLRAPSRTARLRRAFHPG